jgi:hypothetical protein
MSPLEFDIAKNKSAGAEVPDVLIGVQHAKDQTG